MIRITARTSRRTRTCAVSHAGRTIHPGERYLEHVASPWAPDGLGVGRWTRLIECADCAAQSGRPVEPDR